MYRAVPQSPSAALYLVPKPVSSPQRTSLDPRGAFVVQTAAAIYVWEVGSESPGSRGPREGPQGMDREFCWTVKDATVLYMLQYVAAPSSPQCCLWIQQ
jgi:hypothetical protein